MYLPNMWPHPGMPAMPPAPPGMQMHPMGFRPPADFASYAGYLGYPPPYGTPFGYSNAQHLPPMMAPWSMAPGITSYGPFVPAGPAAGAAAGDGDDEDDDKSSSDDSSDMDDGDDSSSDDIDPWATAVPHSNKPRRLDDASTSNCSGSSIRSDDLQQGQQEEVQQPAWKRAMSAKPVAQHASRLPAPKQAAHRSTGLPKPAVPAAKAATRRGQLSLADVLLQVAQEEEDAEAGRRDEDDDIWPGLCSWGSGNKRK